MYEIYLTLLLVTSDHTLNKPVTNKFISSAAGNYSRWGDSWHQDACQISSHCLHYGKLLLLQSHAFGDLPMAYLKKFCIQHHPKTTSCSTLLS